MLLTRLTTGLLVALTMVGAHSAERIDEMLDVDDPALADVESRIRAREFDQPITWLETHIDTLESISHRYDPELVRPLVLLGDAELGKGNYGTALEHYGRAVHVSRVNDGLHSASHVEIVYREAQAYKAMGNYEQANNREEYAYQVLKRAHGGMDEDLLPGVYKLARWYRDTQNLFSARAMYQHALEILIANGKHDDLESIPAYEGIAWSYRLERFPPYFMSGGETRASEFSSAYEESISINNFPAGERALQQIIRIYRNTDSINPVVVSEAILELADWYLLFDKTKRAYPLYEYVYDALEELEPGLAGTYFGEPKLLYFPVPQDPRPPDLQERGDARTGYVELAYEISDSGYPRSLKTVASEPPGLMDFRVRKSLRLSRYRPMIVEGQALATQDFTYRYEFDYFEELEPAQEVVEEEQDE